MSEANIRLSWLEEERFGIRTARSELASAADLASIFEFCRTNQVQLLIARCPVNELPTVQAMEQQGFLLMDTLLYYERDLITAPLTIRNPEIGIRPAQSSDIQQITTVASLSFQNYGGHYHADSRLNRTQCDAAYVSWAVGCCHNKELADRVLVAEVNGSVVGFGALKCTAPDIADGRLYGVTPSVRGRGVYRALMQASLEWAKAQECMQMRYSTQITNIAAQMVCTQLGFAVSHAYYTFHRWFDEHTL